MKNFNEIINEKKENLTRSGDELESLGYTKPNSKGIKTLKYKLNGKEFYPVTINDQIDSKTAAKIKKIVDAHSVNFIDEYK